MASRCNYLISDDVLDKHVIISKVNQYINQYKQCLIN